MSLFRYSLLTVTCSRCGHVQEVELRSGCAMCVAESKANEELIREAMRVGTSEQLSKSRRKRERKKKRDIFTALDFVRTFGW